MGRRTGDRAARGIAQHARDALGFERLICLITHGNIASVKVAEKIGVTFEREHRDELGPCMIYACPLV